MAGYGIDSDYLGLAFSDTNINLAFISGEAITPAKGVVDAEDSEGNIAASGTHDGGPGVAVTCNYELHMGTMSLAGDTTAGYDFQLGPNGSGVVIASIAAGTSNGGWPTIVATGITSATDTALMPTFSLPAVSIIGKRTAQLMKFTKSSANWRLTSSNLTATGTIEHALDSTGTVGAMAFRGAKVEITAEGVEVDSEVAVTWDSTMTETQVEGKSHANIAFATGSVGAFINLAKDT